MDTAPRADGMCAVPVPLRCCPTGHYDVQPAAEPDWATNPFELNSVNEYLYGRGVSDNKVGGGGSVSPGRQRQRLAKPAPCMCIPAHSAFTRRGLRLGRTLHHIHAYRVLSRSFPWVIVTHALALRSQGPILAFIFAVRELMNAAAEAGAPGGTLLPVNVAFVFEGEEENGSRGFAQAITQNLRWFEGTQLIIISNTLWVGENVPCLTYGMRGMLSLTVQVRAAGGGAGRRLIGHVSTRNSVAAVVLTSGRNALPCQSRPYCEMMSSP